MLKPSPDVGSADVMELKLSMFDLILFFFSRRITGVFTFRPFSTTCPEPDHHTLQYKLADILTVPLTTRTTPHKLVEQNARISQKNFTASQKNHHGSRLAPGQSTPQTPTTSQAWRCALLSRRCQHRPFSHHPILRRQRSRPIFKRQRYIGRLSRQGRPP